MMDTITRAVVVDSAGRPVWELCQAGRCCRGNVGAQVLAELVGQCSGPPSNIDRNSASCSAVS